MYKGFYVGRYETSLNGTVAQSKAGEPSMSGINWFRMYENSKTYGLSNPNLGVESEMIWGCQWDAMLKWMVGNGIEVTSSTPTDTARKKQASKNTTKTTGVADSNDILSNVYDLLGCRAEWTQEGYNNSARVLRSAWSDHGYGAANTLVNRYVNYAPTDDDTSKGSRLSLYIK